MLKSPDGRERLFEFVGQDPDDCVMRPAAGRKPFGLLDTTQGKMMKDLMFLYGLGWHPMAADALLLRSDFNDVCSKKLERMSGPHLRADIKAFLTAAVKKALLSTKVELHMVGFGTCASALLATADEGSSLRPDALSIYTDRCVVDGARHSLPWATVSGGNVSLVNVFHADGGVCPYRNDHVVTFVLGAFLHTSSLGGD